MNEWMNEWMNEISVPWRAQHFPCTADRHGRERWACTGCGFRDPANLWASVDLCWVPAWTCRRRRPPACRWWCPPCPDRRPSVWPPGGRWADPPTRRWPRRPPRTPADCRSCRSLWCSPDLHEPIERIRHLLFEKTSIWTWKPTFGYIFTLKTSIWTWKPTFWYIFTLKP